MSERGVISRLLAVVHALLPEDWFGRAGKSFSKTADAISEFAEEHQVRPRDLADEGVALVRSTLRGKANKDLAAAVKDFAEAEHTKIESELKRRSLQSKVRKEEAEAALAELQVVHSEADLLRKLKELAVLIRRDHSGHLTVLPAPPNVDLEKLALQRTEQANARAERFVLGAIILDNAAFPQAANVLEPADFSIESHRVIYESMIELARIGRDIDFVNLAEHLSERRRLEAAGGVGYLTGVTDDLPRIRDIGKFVEFIQNAGSRAGKPPGGS
jgi:DnaB-like helicase N terminal domain